MMVVTVNGYASKATMMVTDGIEGPEIVDDRPGRTNSNKSETGKGVETQTTFINLFLLLQIFGGIIVIISCYKT